MQHLFRIDPKKLAHLRPHANTRMKEFLSGHKFVLLQTCLSLVSVIKYFLVAPYISFFAFHKHTL